MTRVWRTITLSGIDLALTVGAILLAFAIRFAFDGRVIPEEYLNVYFHALVFLVPIRLIVYHLMGLYKPMWAYASLAELLRIVLTVSVDTVLSAITIMTLADGRFPRSVIVIAWALKIGLLGGVRLALRIRREWYAMRQTSVEHKERVLIIGAGDAGAMLAREYVKHPEMACTVVGFIDDDPRKRGLYIAGKPVLGNRSELDAIVRSTLVTHLVIAMPSVKGPAIREIVEAAKGLGLQIKTLPGMYELVNGAVSVKQIRDVEIEDLLGRDVVKVDLEAIAAYVTGEIVLVTGAGGSIGSELCRQVGRFCPKELLILGHGENSIYEIDLELRAKFPGVQIRPIIADIQDESRINQVFEQYRPGVVFHAAAHKHVPMMEQNPTEAIKNNVFGTLHVAKAADAYRAKRFVLISSDKAVNPTSVMGATKRAAECVIQSLALTSQTVFVAVRFGNVLGSRGSVIPLFKKQIAAGGPVTVTDPRMVRYFMTIPEAVQLVIQAASMGQGGEIFVLDMGAPVRIEELARDLIRLSGFKPEVEIPIVYSGIREGEKLFEELLTAEEGTAATLHNRIFVAGGRALPDSVIGDFLETMYQMAASGQVTNQTIRDTISEVVTSDGKLNVVSAVKQ